MQVLEKVAKAISRNYGVQVYFRGRDAYTDGKTIVLPTLPDNLDENDEAKVRGYCDHEIGHVVYTDMPIYKGFARKGKKQSNVLNLIEDLWIEKKQGVDYPGAHVNMERTANLLHAQTVAEKGFAEANEHILNKVWLEGRRQNCGMKFPDADMTADVQKVLGADFFERLAKVESTAQAIELAKHVIGKVGEYEPPEEKPNDLSNDGDESSENEQGQGDDGEDSESSEGEENASQSEGDDADGDGYDGDFDEMRDGSDAEGDTDADDIDGDGGESKGEGMEGDGPEMGQGDIAGEVPSGRTNEGNDEQQSGPEENNTINTDLEDFEDDLDALKEEIEQKHMDALRGREYMPFSTEGDKVITIEDYLKGKSGRYSRGMWTESTATYNRMKRELGGLNTIKAKIANMFNTKVASKWITDREQGKVNSRVLAKVKTGNRRVFREKYVSRQTDTAVTFLVDFSGSMGGSRIKNAMQAVILFLETLQATKIKSEVLGYTTDGTCKGADRARGNYGRVENLVTYIIKEHGEPFNGRVKKRISNYGNVNMSQNCDPDNVKIAYDRLKARPEKRKILFVLSDGQVANLGNCTLGMRYYKKLAKKIEREGVVEVVGVGFMCNAIKQYWTNCIEINESGSALANGLFEQLRKIFKV